MEPVRPTGQAFLVTFGGREGYQPRQMDNDQGWNIPSGARPGPHPRCCQARHCFAKGGAADPGQPWHRGR